MGEAEHVVQFYERDAFLVRSVGDFIGSALLAGDGGVVIATQPHRDDLERHWKASGLDVDVARKRGQYVPLDAAETLSKFMVDGWPDEQRFIDIVGGLITAKVPYERVRAFGEMVALLWGEGKCDAAVRLEEIWSAFIKAHRFSLCCAYPMNVFAKREFGESFLRICSEHSRVLPAESYATLDPNGRLRIISQLQQKATLLEAEIVEREKVEAALSNREKELTEANRRKDEFLGMLGHELRNPLAAVRNAVMTVRLEESRRERALDIADRQLDHLTRLVDDLLDVARITQGKIRLRRELVAFGDVIESAVESTRGLFRDGGQTLAVSLPGYEMSVKADAVRLEQVVVNLLQNAAKYTPAGGRVDVTGERRGDQAELRIRDDGTGIAPEMLPNVFDLFAQAATGLDRAGGGLGIGLTIVQRLVELHGGGVEARSAGLGRGAEFIVRLPLAAASTARPEPAKGAIPSANHRLRILVVEDNVDVAESLEVLLQYFGHSVQTVHNGRAALEAGRARRFDVALLDIGLPGMDGYEVARRLRVLPNAARTVFVALTGYLHGEEKSRDAVFHHYLLKPLTMDALRNLLAGVGRAEASPEVRGLAARTDAHREA